jgi:hypothetical protein
VDGHVLDNAQHVDVQRVEHAQSARGIDQGQVLVVAQHLATRERHGVVVAVLVSVGRQCFVLVVVIVDCKQGFSVVGDLFGFVRRQRNCIAGYNRCNTTAECCSGICDAGRCYAQ